MISDLTYFFHLTAHLIENIITISIFGFLFASCIKSKKIGSSIFLFIFSFFYFLTKAYDVSQVINYGASCHFSFSWIFFQLFALSFLLLFVKLNYKLIDKTLFWVFMILHMVYLFLSCDGFSFVEIFIDFINVWIFLIFVLKFLIRRKIKK
ncbi:MAG TPA: hypothetical protein VJB35_06260 [Candidatus Nanoarchaeia archaeon]|nr:hypothetical protein [Candidatus Nanoarchaeia archaeon]